MRRCGGGQTRERVEYRKLSHELLRHQAELRGATALEAARLDEHALLATVGLGCSEHLDHKRQYMALVVGAVHASLDRAELLLQSRSQCLLRADFGPFCFQRTDCRGLAPDLLDRIEHVFWSS